MIGPRRATACIVQDPEAVTEQMLQPDSAFMHARQAWVQQQEQLRTRAPRRLDLSGLPVFAGAGRRTLAESLARMVPGLVVLLLGLGLSLLIAGLRFGRDEPT